MEGNSTNSDLTEDELRDAGASASFVTYYLTAKRMGKETHATRHAEKVVAGEMSANQGGGFFRSLWDANPRWSHTTNQYGADGTNKKILQEAGVYPSDDQEAIIS